MKNLNVLQFVRFGLFFTHYFNVIVKENTTKVKK